jgi:hypothetical protein
VKKSNDNMTTFSLNLHRNYLTMILVVPVILCMSGCPNSTSLGHDPAIPKVLPIIPGAIGFGTETVAGRGGEIIRVTNLNADGEGSLKAAIDAVGPRVVIFETSGTIEIPKDLTIRNPYITIAGQTAPSPGITVRGGGLSLATHDILVQHIRIRVGNDDCDPITENCENRDAIKMEGGELYNVVLDHCSFSWSVDEMISTWNKIGNKDITIRYCIMSEGLNYGHPKGEHGYGPLFGLGTERVFLTNSLMAHLIGRNPLIRDNVADVVVANNVVYNPGPYKGSRIYIGSRGSQNIPLNVSIVGNVMIPGANTGSGRQNFIHVHKEVADKSLVFVEDNEAPGRTNDPWSVVVHEAPASVKASAPPIWIEGFKAMPSKQVLPYVLSNAGARPTDRDAVDQRIVNDVVNGTGKAIYSQNEVGGWPDLAQNSRSVNSNIPGVGPLPSNPHGDDNGNGYTNLEEWLHVLSALVEGRNRPL